MKITRHYTKENQDVYSSNFEFRTTSSEIRNPDGSTVFSQKGVEVPLSWSQVAADVLAQKYFRKAGIPSILKKVPEKGVPSFLWRSVPDDERLGKIKKDEQFKGESSCKEVFDRMVGAWTYWGWRGGYFSSEKDALAYYDEMRFILTSNKEHQIHLSGSTRDYIGHME